MKLLRGLMASALALGVAGTAWAQSDNIGKLQQFKTTGTSLEIPTVEQGGARAEQIRKNLEQIKLPQGFKIDLYAVVPDARHIAVGPQGVVELSAGVIRAERHVHMNDRDAAYFGGRTGDRMDLRVTSACSVVFQDLLVRADATSKLEVHLDTDEANAADLDHATKVELVRQTGDHCGGPAPASVRV